MGTSRSRFRKFSWALISQHLKSAKRINALILVLLLGVLLLPQRWVSLGAPGGSGSLFRQAFESQSPQERQAPPERLAVPSQLDSLPLAEGKVSRDPRRWRELLARGVNRRFQEIFPGVDLVFAGTAKRMEALLIVKPGVDPSSIRFEFPLAEVISHDAQANIWIALPDGDLGFMRPLLSRQNEKVSGSFAIDGSSVVLQTQDHDVSQGVLVRFDVVFPVRAVNLLDQILYRTFKSETPQPTSQPSLSAPEQAPVITATKTVDQTTVAPGGTLMYTVTISNTGGSTANNVQFTDTISNNTTLVGGSVNSSPIGQNDTYTATGNIPISPTNGVLFNDIDPDTNNNTGLTVTQVQGLAGNVGVATNTTAAGFGGVNGSVTVQSNGSFTYEPPPGFTGNDTFTYRVADANGKFDDATVTITVSGMAWFINNNAGGSLNRGTFTHPFTSIASFNTANTGAALRPAAGHVISLRTGTGTYSETDGVNLLNTQKLIGEAVAFNTEFTADANSTAAYTTFATGTMAAPVIVTSSGNGVDLASGNTVRGLNVGNTPGFFGFNGTAVGTLTIGTVNVTGTGGAINISTSGTFGSTVNFGTLESISSPTHNINLVGVSGTLGVSSGGGGLSGSAGNSANVRVSGGSVNLTYPGNVTKNNAGPMVNVLGGHTGTLTFQTGTLSATNGTGLQFDNADGTYNFNGTTTLNNGTVVNIINGSGGSFTFGTGASITVGNNDVAVTIDGGTAAFTYSGGITKTGNGDAIRVQGGHATGTVTFQTGTISATGGNGLQFDNADGTYNFNGMTTLNGGDAAVDIVNGSSGNFTFSANTTVTNPSGTAFRVDGGNGTITYNGTLSKTGTSSGRLIDIMNRNGGSVSFTSTLTNTATGATGILVQNNTSGNPTFTFSGATKTLSTGANAAVTLSNNTTSTISFSNGGLDIDTTGGAGFSATGGGTVNVTTGTNPNTIDSTTGTALNVANTTIGASNLNFRSISSNGATNGIVLNNTGASGGLTVSGNGGTCTSVATCTGGTIQSATTGISLTNTRNLSIDRMFILNTTASGIQGTTTVNFSFTNGRIENSGTGGGAQTSNIAFNTDSAGTENNVSGTFTVTGCTLLNAFFHGISVKNFNGTLSSVNVSNNTITSATTIANSKGHGIQFNAFGTSPGGATTASITGATINLNTITNFPSDSGIQVIGGNAVEGGASSTVGTGGTPINITNNIISGQSAANRIGTQGILFNVNGTGTGNFNVSGNSITNTVGNSISHNVFGDAVVTSIISNNTVVKGDTANTLGTSGIAGGTSFTTGFATNTPSLTVTIANNNISQTDGNGILMVARDNATGSLNITVRSNTVAAPLGGVRPGIRVDAGNATGDNDVCLDMFGNTSAGSGGSQGLGLRKQGTSTTINAFGVEGMAATATPGVEAYVASLNPAGGGVLLISATSGFSNCGSAPLSLPVETGERNSAPQSEAEDSASLSPEIRQWLDQLFFKPVKAADYFRDAEKFASAPTTTEAAQTNGGSNGGVREIARPVLSAFADSLSYLNPLRLFEKSAAASANIAPETETIQPAIQDRAQRPTRTEGRAETPQRQQPKPPTRILASPEAGETVLVGPFNLPAGESVQIMFSVTVTGTTGCMISNQGSVSGNNFSNVLTDDPNVAGSANPTVTTILQAPSAITCPTNIVGTTDPGQCTSVQTFATPTTSAGCPVPTVTCVPASGFAFPVGTTTVTCTASNSQGSTMCSFTVTITDNQAPTLTCPAPIMANTAPGVCTAVVNYTPTIMDNCPGATFLCSPPSGSTFPLGVTTVSCTGMDAVNNPATPCSFTVTVVDNQDPVISACPSPISQPAAAGQCSATVTYTPPTAMDNCGAAPVVCAPASGSTFNVGTTTVTCTATDGSNRTASCSFTVTVTDTQNPTITCPTNQSVTSNVPIAVNYPDPTVMDNCPNPTFNCVPASGLVFAVGTTTVTCTATDASNNTASCMFTVSVIPCTINCPMNQTAVAAMGSCAATVNYPAPTTTGMCGTVTCSPASGSSFPVGITTVTCSTTAGPSCSFTVTVSDNQNPTLTCPTPIVTNTAPDTCAANVTYTVPTASDNCPGATVMCSPSSGSSFPRGVTTVTCTATDASNNTASCTFTVTVNDNQNPTIACPNNISIPATSGQCSAVATYTTPTPTDNCPGATATCTPASGSTFAVGTTTVTCTATDASNNTASCTFTVTVNDTQNPTLTCPTPIITNAASGQCSATVSYTVPTASDNCPGATVACVPNTGSSFPVGTTTVTCTATDASNNTASCTFTVTVNDTQNPTVACPTNVTGVSTGTTTVSYQTPLAIDNCPGVNSVTCNPSSGSSFPLGTTTVTCSVTDAAGNPASCSFPVIVLTPLQALEALIDKVAALSPPLDKEQVYNLTTILEEAIIELEKVTPIPVCNQLATFINEVQAIIQGGTLSPAQGQMLIDLAAQTRQALGCPQSLSTTKAPGDFDGDGKTDLALWNSGNGEWQIIRSGTNSELSLMLEGGFDPLNDLLVPGDYDGDEKTDAAVYRRSTGQWHIHRSSDGQITIQSWGTEQDVPVAADYDGDGKTDLAVWRSSESRWHIRRSSDEQTQIIEWGSGDASLGDIPVPADYDGDGKADAAVFRQANGGWYIQSSSDGSTIFRRFGVGTDVPVPADYDGDGKTDLAVWRGSVGMWLIFASSNHAAYKVAWGASSHTDVPVAGDYDGDGKADLAVWRGSELTWFIKLSSDQSEITRTQSTANAVPALSARRQ